ncbi:MAG: rhodanese-like domain-containing protein [Bacteroidetes bacterium]|nr:rhodanese-like domain-containing protein [Bacteroidota bacterium]
MSEKSEIGFISGGILNISPKEAFELSKSGFILIDVREEYLNSFKIPDIDNVLYFPKSNIDKDYLNLPESKKLIFFDSVGIRSKEVVLFLKEKGFENIVNMVGGIVDWEKDKLPMKTNIEERLTGSCMCQLKPRDRKK